MPRPARTVVALALALVVESVGAADAPTLRQVVAAGQAAPGGGTFEGFNIEALPVVAPTNGRGQVVFFATLLRGRATEAFFLASGTRIVRLAADGDPAPGGGTLSGFGRHPIPALNDQGAVAFAAAVSGGKTVEGVFVVRQGRLQTVAVTGTPAPAMASGTFGALDAPALNNRGDVVFLASIRRGRENTETIYVHADRKLRKLVAQGDPAPAGGTFAGFGPPAVTNRGAIAFGAVVDGPAVPGGLFVSEGDKIRMLVGAGEETPIGGIFAKFSERLAINDAGTVAFTAVLNNAPAREAVFVVESGRARKVVALGDAAPGGGTFSHFGLWPALAADGAVAFTASLDHGPSEIGVFVASVAGVKQVAALGDPLPGGGKLTSFGLYPVVSLSPTGTLTFATARTPTGEGAAAIFAVHVPGR
jgi:hypothetical protein